MKYLADSDVVINHLRGKVPLSLTSVKAGISISVITYGELIYGAFKSKKTQKNLGLIDSFLQDLKIEILPLNKDLVFNYGQLKAELEAKGQRLDEFDLLIASTAAFDNLTLLTNNQKHFARIPNLKISN